jgi:DNA-binding LytR/AlgR family response regulator
MLNRYHLRLSGGDRRFIGPAIILAAWTLVAMVAAVQVLALVRLDGRHALGDAMLARLSILPLWALATPFILRSARRFRVVDAENHVSLAFLAIHASLGSAFIVLSNAVIRLPAAFGPVAGGGGLAALIRTTMQGVAEYFPPALVVYGVIVAIGHVGLRPPAAAPAVVPTPDPVPARVVVEEPDASTQSAVATIDGHLTVRQWNRVHLVRVDEIDFVEAEDNYVVVHAASKAYKGRDRISDVESQLDARRFVRIHRSTIVHVTKIREVQPLTHGDHAVILRDGKVLRVARSRRQALEQALGIQL